MTDPVKASELPPVLKTRNSRNTKLVYLRIGLLVAVIVFIVAKVKQAENASKLPVTRFLLSGEQGTKFVFTATASNGEAETVTTQLYKQRQKVLTTDRLNILSCKLERLEGAGTLTLEVFADTNLMTAVELTKDKRVVELKKDSWSHREF